MRERVLGDRAVILAGIMARLLNLRCTEQGSEQMKVSTRFHCHECGHELSCQGEFGHLDKFRRFTCVAYGCGEYRTSWPESTLIKYREVGRGLS